MNLKETVEEENNKSKNSTKINKEKNNINFSFKQNKDFSFSNDDENDNPNKMKIKIPIDKKVNTIDTNNNKVKKKNSSIRINKINKSNIINNTNNNNNNSMNSQRQSDINRLEEENNLLKQEIEIVKSNLIISDEKELLHQKTIQHIRISLTAYSHASLRRRAQKAAEDIPLRGQKDLNIRLIVRST